MPTARSAAIGCDGDVDRTRQDNEQTERAQLSWGRALLAANPHFVTEKIELQPESRSRLRAAQETWLLSMAGRVQVGGLEVKRGEVVHLQGERPVILSGTAALQALIAYAGPTSFVDLLEESSAAAAAQVSAPREGVAS